MDFTTQDASEILSKTRTEGDGMETVPQLPESTSAILPDTRLINRKVDNPAKPFSRQSTSSFPIEALINLTPKEIHYVNRKTNTLSKEPRFVPYEPYKAATRPILPKEKKTQNKKKPSKNNLDLNVLVSQMSLIDTNMTVFKESKRRSVKTSEEVSSTSQVAKQQWDAEKEKLNEEIMTLKHSNETLKETIKQQAQVNKELKTMLVASMGEDLETTVQTLTEDKQQLASALLNSAQHLSTHQEQTEWLAGQCEVWRSKFLASSLMVEELAGWKSLFTQRTDNLQTTLCQILEERNRVRDILIHTYRNLQSLHENWLTNLASKEMYYTSINEMGGYGVMEQTPIGSINLAFSKPKSSNILDLASVNLKFSENLCNGVEKVDDFSMVLNQLPTNTEAENMAEKLLASPLEVCGKNDHPSSALVHHAYTKTGMTPNIACCSHCNGQVKLL